MPDKILFVDDEPNVISSLKRALIDEDFEVLSANGGAEGLEILKNNEVKVVISDERMPKMSGSEFLSMVKETYPDTVRIMLTGHASLEAAMNAVNNGEIYRFFTKPWDDTHIRLALRSSVEKYDLETENRRLLAIVKKQALNLKLLEKQYPNITKLETDEDGKLVIPDLSQEEFDRLVIECEREFM